MILDGINTTGGEHCETSTLDVLLRHAGIELSEPMLFGLGEGLGFIYWDGKNLPFPFLGGRAKPAEITRKLTDRLGLTLRVKETSSVRTAWRNVAEEIDAGAPVGLQLDSYHLEYFTSKVHFGGHFVALYGYDDERAFVVDTAQQGGAVSTSLESVERARAEKGLMTAKNRSFTITANGPRVPLPDAIRTAVRANAAAFLDPPIANLGYRGIGKAAVQVRKWLDRSDDPARDLPQAAILMERAGTGGALFRRIYRDFLEECTSLVDDAGLRTAYEKYREITPLWTEVAHLFTQAGETGDARPLSDASAVLSELAQREQEAMTALATVQRARS
ncbi:BtrH N-terminal domain-containing protein [Amycolatopsis keratiniphila]|uniref:BtrH N-terminal domain-containing protein n=1 Tax=Amycolatopsis keratiniphila TaxID=129921 RepID=UPI00087A2882|nr:BtrH N-terminal domain-containing protein [Amycolatopsis keratiniphila]OLZ59047.1 lantibiotic ABC transporter [Amycolatopsis keratiniphila subsp. nogabecina]SDU04573.1 Butirosin biosynthesis protein H, N-terminal [Amycolatopsis keratiniphila]